MVLVLHTGTGRYNVRGFRGLGGAVMNHTVQACDAFITIMAMVAGGVLDRFPDVHVCTIEGGSSWLAALAERMDEVYEAHAPFVRPKLSMQPSEVIRRQVHCGFQYDRAAIMARSVTGTAALMWGSDYPHHEGTFPRSKEVIAHLFDGIDISEKDKAASLAAMPRGCSGRIVPSSKRPPERSARRRQANRARQSDIHDQRGTSASRVCLPEAHGRTGETT